MVVGGQKSGTNCEKVDWQGHHGKNLAQRIVGQQPIAHSGHVTILRMGKCEFK
jgi:hypothetical protein